MKSYLCSFLLTSFMYQYSHKVFPRCDLQICSILLHLSIPPHLSLYLVVATFSSSHLVVARNCIFVIPQPQLDIGHKTNSGTLVSYFLYLGAVRFPNSLGSQSSRSSLFFFICAYKMPLFLMIFSFSCNILPNTFNSSQ